MKSVRLVLGAVAVPIVVIAIGLTVLMMPAKKTGTVAIPPDDASPERVVRAFIDAVNAHDCDTAAALATKEFEGVARGWCSDAKSLRDLKLGETQKIRSKNEPRVQVGVSFNLTWRLFHNDSSLPEGQEAWGFELVATKDGARWRIADQGVV